MDIVFIHNFEIKTRIGVFDWEHNILQTLIFDLDMAWPNQPAAQDDDLSKALDYSKVVDFITLFCTSHQFELIETLIERLAEKIQTQFSVQWLKIRVRKPGAIQNAVVGVEIERGCRA